MDDLPGAFAAVHPRHDAGRVPWLAVLPDELAARAPAVRRPGLPLRAQRSTGSRSTNDARSSRLACRARAGHRPARWMQGSRWGAEHRPSAASYDARWREMAGGRQGRPHGEADFVMRVRADVGARRRVWDRAGRHRARSSWHRRRRCRSRRRVHRGRAGESAGDSTGTTPTSRPSTSTGRSTSSSWPAT